MDLLQIYKNNMNIYLIVWDHNGKVHGSQSHINGNIVSLIVYYEVPSGMRDEVKQRYKNRI